MKKDNIETHFSSKSIDRNSAIAFVSERVLHLHSNITGILTKANSEWFVIEWDNKTCWNCYWSAEYKIDNVVFEKDAIEVGYKFNSINDVINFIDQNYYPSRLDLLKKDIENNPNLLLDIVNGVLIKRKERLDWDRWNRKAMKGGW